MDITRLLRELREQVDNLISLFDLIEDNPEMILSQLLKRENISLIKEILPKTSKETDALKDLINSFNLELIPFLEEKLTGVTVATSKTKSECLEITYGEVLIGYLDIFSNKFTCSNILENYKEVERIKMLNKELEYKNEQIALFEKARENIFLLAESPKEFISIMIRPKHHRNKLITNHVELIDEILFIEKEIVNEKLSLERKRNEFKEYELVQERVSEFFSIRYGFFIESMSIDTLEDIGVLEKENIPIFREDYVKLDNNTVNDKGENSLFSGMRKFEMVREIEEKTEDN